MKNYNVNRYAYNSNLAYDYRYEEDYGNKFDIRVEKSRGLSKSKPKIGFFPFCGSLVVVAVVALLFQYTQISTLENGIAKVKDEIKAIEDEIYNADVKIAETLDVNYVKKIAIGKLGMVEPTDGQLMYISVPNQDYTVNY